MSKRIRKKPEVFSASPAAGAALMSARKAKSRKKVEVSIKNHYYRELAKSKKENSDGKKSNPIKKKGGSAKKCTDSAPSDKKWLNQNQSK